MQLRDYRHEPKSISIAIVILCEGVKNRTECFWCQTAFALHGDKVQIYIYANTFYFKHLSVLLQTNLKLLWPSVLYVYFSDNFFRIWFHKALVSGNLEPKASANNRESRGTKTHSGTSCTWSTFAICQHVSKSRYCRKGVSSVSSWDFETLTMKERNKKTTETTRTCQVTTVKGLTCHKPNIQNFALLLFSLSRFVMMNWWGVCLLWSTTSFKKRPLTKVDVFVRWKSNKIPNRWCNMYSVSFFFSYDINSEHICFSYTACLFVFWYVYLALNEISKSGAAAF